MNLPRVYGMSSSGNCYKVRLLSEQLRLPYEWIEIDVRTGVTRQPEFLSRNPNGRVPTLEYEPGRYLAESNAILVYLAEGSAFWPQHRLARAQALQWMFFEQYSHEPYIAVARFICTMLPAHDARRSELPRLHQRGYQALAVMEQHLVHGRFFVERRLWHRRYRAVRLYARRRRWRLRAAALPGGAKLDRARGEPAAFCADAATVRSRPAIERNH